MKDLKYYLSIARKVSFLTTYEERLKYAKALQEAQEWADSL